MDAPYVRTLLARVSSNAMSVSLPFSAKGALQEEPQWDMP